MTAERPGQAALTDPAAAEELASRALAQGDEERAVPLVEAAAARFNSPVVWQWAGLLHRSLDQHEQALECFRHAALLAPDDAKIAHGRAQVTLEAGLDAVALFERARALAPHDGSIWLGLASARFAVGDMSGAMADLKFALSRSPGWIAGHEQLAQLRALSGERDKVGDSVNEALLASPQSEDLWAALFALRVRGEDYQSLARDIDRARQAGVSADALRLFEAICAAELDDPGYPASLLWDAPPGIASQLPVWRIRNLLRHGRAEEALPLIDEELCSDRADATWPYAGPAWRIAGDPRWEWLERQPGLVHVVDLAADLPPLEALRSSLLALHTARGEFVDQSVRGGTQTTGRLFSLVDSVVQQTRSAVVGAVGRYISTLPAMDAEHPLLRCRRDRPLRFSGSWSVRLRGGGRHSNHIHPQGWISSALYVTLPPRAADEPSDAGWLTLGEPDESLRLGVEPWAKIEPREGQLVLFPSWMWHGTRPFAEGERLTVAFDVARPG